MSTSARTGLGKGSHATRTRLAGIALAWLCGCSSAPVASAPAIAPHDDRRLQTATEGHHALEAQLAATPADDLEYCRTNSGDCLITVSERRQEIVRRDYLTDCDDPNPEKQSPCAARSLQQQGKLEDLASLYEAENWCTRQLLECAAGLVKDAVRAAARQRARTRRREVEATPASVKAATAPPLAEEQAKFIRSTLAPAAQSNCSPTTPTQCAATLKAPAAEFEAELEKEEGAYSADRAFSAYAALEQAKADCYRDETACLKGQLAENGGDEAATKWLDENLSLIEQQARATHQADPAAAAQCVSEGVLQHSDAIVSAYRDYVHDSSATALTKLLKTFVALHQAQLWCIQHPRKERAR